MAGAMRKVGVYLGLLEDSDRYEDDEYYDDAVSSQQTNTRSVSAVRDDQPAPVSSISERRRPAPVQPATTMAELSRITTLHPRNYNEARTIGEHFREGIPVI